MLPDRKVAVVILVNRSGANLPKTSERALETVTPLPAATPPTAPMAMDSAEMAKYAGGYTNPPSRIDLTVRDGKLYFRRGTQEGKATKVGDFRFAVTPQTPGATSLTFTLVPGTDGTIGFLHMGSRALKRIPTKAS